MFFLSELAGWVVGVFGDGLSRLCLLFRLFWGFFWVDLSLPSVSLLFALFPWFFSVQRGVRFCAAFSFLVLVACLFFCFWNFYGFCCLEG